ncbi:MAG: VIT1/CCC1 transporter family protein [Gallionella sp.]|jgi:VIT1/CCC1 family predicted Fe2+/Mn2+ transporter
MNQSLHIERHFLASKMVRDIVIGMADGLTVPFALAAGLSGAVTSSHIITTAGLAEIAAGSIAMGLGGFLAARGDAEHYARELLREQKEVQTTPDQEAAEIVEVFNTYGVSAEQSAPVVAALCADREAWVNFMMRFELGLERPDPAGAIHSAATIACAYIAGGLIPIAPYFVASEVSAALPCSIAITLLALLAFGYIKGRYTGTAPIRSALQTLLIGGIAAAAAFALARAIA